jgi:hypothetical protein
MRNPMEAPGTTNSQVQARVFLETRRERIVFAVLRNLIALVGILFLSWSAQNLIVLYFVDTLAAMWALITALALNFPEAKAAPTFLTRVGNYASVLFASAFLVAFMAIPLGMPLFIFLMMVQWDWSAALAENDFVYGLVLIGALSLIGMFRYYQIIARVTPDKSNVKNDFGILITRWVIVLLLIYGLGFLLGGLGAYVLVIGYAIATVASEIYPERFVNLFGRGSKNALP